MTGHNYLDFLQNGLPDQLEDVPLVTCIAVYFQHYGASSHYTRIVMQYLNETLVGGSAVAVPLIGRQLLQTSLR
jgi:hypothetical protein